MCGFVALYNKTKQPVSQTSLNQMTDLLSHRGPDDAGSHLDKYVGLGFRRLSIIDLKGGRQPLCNETGDIWITFNGEIYNYQELQSWLKDRGHRFKTDSDTETIVHLYEEVGFDCPKHLRGMFSFMIWDRKKQILFGARDHFGVKPFYWTETADSFAFGSEIKSLLEAPGTERKVNPTSFYHYLTFQYVPDPDTMFEGIHKLPPGHSITIKEGEMKIEPYWSVEFKPEDRPFSHFVEGTREALKESVDKHLVSDVARGSFLSSGIDSSSIVALMRQHEDVKTFTVGFDIPGYSELDIARETAQFLKSDHYELKITADRYLEELPRLIWHQDEPVADPSAIALYFAAELASQHASVVLSGEGADEFFGGYNIYREPHSLRHLTRMPTWMRASLGNFASLLPEGVKGKSFLIRGSKEVEDRFFGNALIFSEEMKQKIATTNLGADPAYRRADEITAEIYERAHAYDDVTKMQYLDIHTWMRGNILMKADKMTMANSLELRVPFVDPKVFEFAATIPTKYKIANGTTKYVLREAMKDLLPPQIKSRKKLGFPVPTRHWLKHDFYDWARNLIYTSETDEWINKSFALHMLKAHKEGKADYGRKIWTLLVFMLWHQIFIEQKISFGPYVSPYIESRRQQAR
ncbi:asparagine synthase (glutamine-hydrolyzing) [Ammoniphilus oxalaticus]|uniref:asparagine synthase (glutamine-hydrolyzing) n=1 Tax=Ammoniphilus oxalaticus TaxID=66863 RepID=A0A419SIY7_9BACL|nr:asparagine synthase (glutamine-hydrolyzing) [Ammoniphilus oxalaticus]RKD23973.1 asparagine synthase (glutamine-hydrolyzing) [Ammoniphilus oxalaticus]